MAAIEAMTSDLDINPAAKELIRQHGDSAAQRHGRTSRLEPRDVIV
jgi:hypothetical protein